MKKRHGGKIISKRKVRVVKNPPSRVTSLRRMITGYKASNAEFIFNANEYLSVNATALDSDLNIYGDNKASAVKMLDELAELRDAMVAHVAIFDPRADRLIATAKDMPKATYDCEKCSLMESHYIESQNLGMAAGSIYSACQDLII